MRRRGDQGQTLEEFLADDGCDLSDDHPHVQLYRDVTPVWHNGESPEELENRIGDGYSCGFAVGYESGLVTAVLKAEWTVGWYQKLREYYLANHHKSEGLMGLGAPGRGDDSSYSSVAFDSDRAPADALDGSSRDSMT